MAVDLIVPPSYPVPLDSRRYCRNGRRPSWIFGQSLAKAANFATVYRRKCVFSKGLQLGTSTLTASTVRPWRWRFRTGYCGASTIAMVGYAISQGTTATIADAPYWYIEYVPVGGGDTITSGEVHGHKPLGLETESPNSLIAQTSVAHGLAPNTVYEAALVLVSKAWVLSLTVYEQHVFYLDESNSGVCPERNYYDGADLVYQDEDRVRDVLGNLYQRNGAHMLSWCTDLSTHSRTRTSSSYANLLDTSVTTVTSASRGFRFQGRYHDSQASSAVACILAAYGDNASTGKVALVDSGGVIAEVTLPTSTGWAQAAFLWSGLGGTDTVKADLHFKGTGAGDTPTSTVYAVSIYEEV